MTWRVARGGGCRTGGVVRLGPPKTSARLTANGLRGEVFDYGLEFFEVGEFVVAAALDEEHGDGDVREVGDGWDGHGIGAEGEIPRLRCAALGMTTWVGDGVWQEDAPAHGEDVEDEAADVGPRLLGEEEGHDLAAHGASGEE